MRQPQASTSANDVIGTIPEERVEGKELVSNNPEEARATKLKTGQYKIRVTIPVEETQENQRLRDVTKELAGDGRTEFKRVHFYKLDVVNTGKRSDNGKPLAEVTIKCNVLDNPVATSTLVLAALGVAGVGGSWFLVDEIQSFFEESKWDIVTIASAIVAIMVGFKTIFS